MQQTSIKIVMNVPNLVQIKWKFDRSSSKVVEKKQTRNKMVYSICHNDKKKHSKSVKIDTFWN